MDKLDKYFEKCIEDAYKAEERNYDASKISWFYIVVDNQILFSIDTPYAKVSRRALFRIGNNIKKNFGFDTEGDFYIFNSIDPNYVCNRFTVGKKEYFLCKVYEIEKGRTIASGRFEKLLEAFYDIPIEDMKEYRYPFNEISWEKYREIYKKAYGEYPEVVITHISKTVCL